MHAASPKRAIQVVTKRPQRLYLRIQPSAYHIITPAPKTPDHLPKSRACICARIRCVRCPLQLGPSATLGVALNRSAYWGGGALSTPKVALLNLQGVLDRLRQALTRTAYLP